jgi:glycosyltransferase involved in cell wall biosynthesis
MTRVLLVTQDLERAGAQRQCVELALGLRATPGFAVDVAVLEPGGPLSAELEASGIPVHACPRRFRWDLSPALAIARLVKQFGADVVHTSLFLPNFYGRVARLRRRPALLVSSLRSTGIEGWPRYLAEILLAPLCDVIIANSEAGRADLVSRGVSPRRIELVRNGLDFERFEPARLTPLFPAIRPAVLGMVAQMESRKDHPGLVEAFAAVQAAHPGVRLLLAGDGSRRDETEAAAARFGVAGSVRFMGTVARSETVYASLDVYVQASASEEGTSNSILEAMASGRPVVATDVGGNREVVEHGRTGLIVPPRDPGALARALDGLLRDPGRAVRMGEAGAVQVRERYGRRRMVEATLAVYRARMAARSRVSSRASSV